MRRRNGAHLDARYQTGGCEPMSRGGGARCFCPSPQPTTGDGAAAAVLHERTHVQRGSVVALSHSSTACLLAHSPLPLFPCLVATLHLPGGIPGLLRACPCVRVLAPGRAHAVAGQCDSAQPGWCAPPSILVVASPPSTKKRHPGSAVQHRVAAHVRGVRQIRRRDDAHGFICACLPLLPPSLLPDSSAQHGEGGTFSLLQNIKVCCVVGCRCWCVGVCCGDAAVRSC